MSQNDFFSEHDTGVGWGTPPRIWRPLSTALGGFDLDPASGAEPTPIASDRFTKEDNGLQQEWYGDVWLNPPYGREHNAEWARKAAAEAGREAVNTLTVLVPNSTGSSWFQQYYADADMLTHISGRIEFHGDGDSHASFYNILVTYGGVPDEYVTACEGLGTVYRRIETPRTTQQSRLSDVAATE